MYIKPRQTRGGSHPTRTYCRFHEGESIIVEINPCIQSTSRKRTAGRMQTKLSRGKQRNERVGIGTASRPATIYSAVVHWAACLASGEIEKCLNIYLEYIFITCLATLQSPPHCTVWWEGELALATRLSAGHEQLARSCNELGKCIKDIEVKKCTQKPVRLEGGKRHKERWFEDLEYINKYLRR